MTLRLYLPQYLEIPINLTNKDKIWLSSPHLGECELEYVKKVFESNWIAPVGPHISDFEIKLSEKMLGHHVAALSSGTAAIHLALILLGVSAGDDVICSTFTFSASVNPIRYIGANPILIDSDLTSWNMCPDLLEKAIKDKIFLNKKPKAIILVHLYGMPANMDKILSVANHYDIPLIEDAAEALGSTYDERPLGTFGDIGVFSFNGNKIITTSGGGALVSSNKELVEKAKYLATQAREDKPHYEHTEIGYNYRLSNVLAAIGLGQLEQLDKRVEQKRYINNFYRSHLSHIKEISFVSEEEPNYSNYWLTTIILQKNSIIDRESLRLRMLEESIETRPLWKPMHLQPIFKSCAAYLNGVSEELFAQGLCFPSGTNMSEKDMKRIIKIIRSVYEA